MRKKVTYIISDVNRALAFEWIAAYLDKRKFELNFIILNPKESILETHLKEQGFDVQHIACRGKKDWPVAFWKVYNLLKKTKPQIVHCHLQQASIIGLLAAQWAGIPIRIHTRHHSSLHHVYFPKGVYWDKMINRLSTHIVAISGEVKKILTDWEKVPEQKIWLIPHGFLLGEFSKQQPDTVQRLFDKYHLEHAFPVVGVISRFTEWKGVQYIVPAFEQVLKKYPDAVLMLFNADGDYAKEIHALLNKLPVTSYRIIPFEPDITAAYHLFTMLVHTPIDEHSEAFGQIYIEAMAAGVPMICTASGIGNDILEHKKNAWVVPHKDSAAIAEGIQAMLNNDTLKQEIIKNGKKTSSSFTIDTMIANLNNLYETN